MRRVAPDRLPDAAEDVSRHVCVSSENVFGDRTRRAVSRPIPQVCRVIVGRGRSRAEIGLAANTTRPGAEEFESSCGGTGNYNNFWLSEREFDNRTSLIVDPPDGRIPYLADVRQVMEEQRRRYLDPEPPASWEELGLLTRCITNGVPNLLPGYNANYQILQAPGYVVILQELFHEARVIPLDGRELIDDGIRQLLGDSRGHWEGDALVIHTRNFSNTTSLRGAGENLHLVERYTRVGPDTVAYEFTVEDPTTFASNWTTRILLKRSEGPIFEYACHEGNRGLPNILSGARAQDRAAAEAGQSGSR